MHNKVNGESLTLITHSLMETQRLGASLGRLLRGNEVICLEGELGAGKTSLIQGIGRGLGITVPITSPTFTLVNEYEGTKAHLYHVDLYRLQSTTEIIAGGIDAYFYGDGVCVIEWAEKARHILPPECLHITLTHAGEEMRDIRLQATGPAYSGLLQRLIEILDLDDDLQPASN
jgi:tRNA threonylcarbamoyladenosine biosynthesis protein TsaE